MKIINSLKIKILVTVALLMTFAGVAESLAQNVTVYQLQSLFLYNFTKHVKWQNSETETFTIGIYQNSEAYKAIKENLSSKQVWGKNINVIEVSSAAEVKNCHIAYVPKSDPKKVVELIHTFDLTNTLLVTEDDLATDGAAISFILQGNKMRFKINKAKIEESGLKVSSSLISIGIPV